MIEPRSREYRSKVDKIAKKNSNLENRTVFLKATPQMGKMAKMSRWGLR